MFTGVIDFAAPFLCHCQEWTLHVKVVPIFIRFVIIRILLSLKM